MESKPVPKWVKLVGYPAFFLFAFLVSLVLTLPYGAMQARAIDEAHRAGYTVSMLSFGPAFPLGVKAKGVIVAPNPTGPVNPDAPPAGLVLDTVVARPTLFPLGAKVELSAFGGEAGVQLSPKGKGGLEISDVVAKGIDASRAGLKALYGIDASGALNIDASDLVFSLPDITKTKGNIKITGKELGISGSLPKLNVGNLDARLKAAEGKITVEKLSLGGGDVEASGEGEIRLSSLPQYSGLSLKVEFKPSDSWAKTSGYGGILYQMGRADGRGFYTANVTGTVSNPNANLKN